MKIGIKVGLSIGIIITIFSVALIISVNQTRQAMIDETGANAITLVRDITDRLDQRIHDSLTDLKIIAIDPQIKKLVSESNNEFDKIDDVDSYLFDKENEWHSYAGIENPIFNEIVKNPLSQRLELFRQTFHESNGIDIFPELLVTNKYGATIAENNRLTDWDQSDRLQFQNVRDYGVHVGDLYYDKSAGVWALELAVEIKDGEEFAGMIKVAYNIEDIITVFFDSTEESPYKTDNFSLISGDNLLIHGLDPNFEIGFDASDAINHFEARKNNEGVFFEDTLSSGIKSIIAYSTSDGYRDFPGLNWLVATTIPEDEFLAQVKNLENFLLMIMIISIIVGTVIGITMIKGIIPPIKNIEKIAKEISHENFEEKVNVTTQDEIGSLGHSINEMGQKLKNAQQQKDEFASMITHELKTPLVPIRGYCEMLKNPKLGALNEDQLDAVEEIEKNASELLELIQHVLNAQKLELHKIKFKIADVKLDEYMKDKYDGLQRIMKEKNIEFINSTESGLIVKADVAKLNEIFTNLVSNAVDFVPNEGGRIEINASNDDKNVKFYVKDNGEGIPKDKQSGLQKILSSRYYCY